MPLRQLHLDTLPFQAEAELQEGSFVFAATHKDSPQQADDATWMHCQISNTWNLEKKHHSLLKCSALFLFKRYLLHHPTYKKVSLKHKGLFSFFRSFESLAIVKNGLLPRQIQVLTIHRGANSAVVGEMNWRWEEISFSKRWQKRFLKGDEKVRHKKNTLMSFFSNSLAFLWFLKKWVQSVWWKCLCK